MKLDSGGYAETVSEAAAAVAAAETAGYDGAWVAETKLDPFVALAVAAERTSRIDLVTGIAVAFARNPMTVAVAANDLQLHSGGRFVLGLGSQVKPHITKRFGMPWSRPAQRMREFVLAVRAIWAAFETGERPGFTGEFYTHTLMTPFFNPGPNPHGNPRIWLAAVGPLMAEVAGEVADGLLCHSFSTERYLREVTLPAVERGRAKAGKTLDGFEISGPSFVATGSTDAELEAAIAETKSQIAFYGSTPSYRPVLDLHGWGGLQDELNALAKRGRWAEMPGLVTDEVLHAFAVVGDPATAAAEIGRRYGDVVQRMTLTTSGPPDPQRWAPVFAALR
ncbi:MULTISPECIES: LLM class F420-dependent oxidoreductase [Actinokineospora]|uniref:LLM class F420-dependent oxidoreductase n=1 Tax=Actinokineospora fastidiosa TaxID=1816 RepID=A0A918G3W2_9PSEU|nr:MULTISPECIES: LLM class F420-dependent oxidoreductase [Actinokineospora]UVS76624.1 F420-dependent glucose-6-phosphate dehydrogenase [Actinokineospora sp. UTMC 2448]GGS16921.1 LLM class F420-dependent oxidoreductase [Actinokineospora fastidiosa]